MDLRVIAKTEEHLRIKMEELNSKKATRRAGQVRSSNSPTSRRVGGQQTTKPVDLSEKTIEFLASLLNKETI